MRRVAPRWLSKSEIFVRTGKPFPRFLGELFINLPADDSKYFSDIGLGHQASPQISRGPGHTDMLPF